MNPGSTPGRSPGRDDGPGCAAHEPFPQDDCKFCTGEYGESTTPRGGGSEYRSSTDSPERREFGKREGWIYWIYALLSLVVGSILIYYTPLYKYRLLALPAIFGTFVLLAWFDKRFVY